MTSDAEQVAAPASPSDPNLPPVLENRVGYLIARAHHICHALADEVMRPLGLSIKHYGCLAVIADEGPLSQQTLGARMGVDRTTIVAVVDDLETKGLVARRRNPVDRRAYALEVTAGGRRSLASAQERLHGRENRMLAGVSEAQRDQLRDLLRALIAGAEADVEAGVDEPV
jgi:DNA-binding MarR family transcriptional regulator